MITGTGRASAGVAEGGSRGDEHGEPGEDGEPSSDLGAVRSTRARQASTEPTGSDSRSLVEVILADLENTASAGSGGDNADDLAWQARRAAMVEAREDAELAATADSVGAYLRQLRRVPLLSASEEVDLARRIEAGLFAAERLEALDAMADAEGRDRLGLCRELGWLVREGLRAKDRLVEANLRLVVSVAKRYTGRGMAFLDLIQEGNLGLIRAVEKFDYVKGYKFSTYATWWIRQAVTRAMADQSRTIRVPIHVVEVINRLGRLQREMLHNLGREPTDEELAHELDLAPAKVRKLRRIALEPVSLDQAVGAGETEKALAEFIEDTDAPAPAEVAVVTGMRDELAAMLTTLSEREAGILRLRFGLVDGESRTLEQVSQVYGLTRERIRQIEHRTLAKLRHPARGDQLREYLA